MLGEPHYGWTNVWIAGKVIGVASYITDVPLDTLNQFFQYLNNYKNNRNVGFNIMYDGEGKEFGLVEIGDSLYWINDYRQLSEIDPVKYHLPSYAKPYQIIMELAKEVIEDVKKYLDQWIFWDTYILCEDSSDKEIKERKSRLEQTCYALECILEELEASLTDKGK